MLFMKIFEPTELNELLKLWLPTVVVATFLAGLTYVAVQQNFRITANDPQIQIAEDAAATLTQGLSPANIVPQIQSDMSQSLAPFLIVYDDRGNPLASSVRLDGQTPKPPQGVFDSARGKGENRLTWQPKPGVRNAIVVTRFAGQKQSGYVVVGRSLRETEKREDQLLTLAELGWLAAVLGSLLTVLMVEWLAPKTPTQTN